MNQLEKLRSRDAAAVRQAALNAAKNRPDQRSPAIIALDGDHWDGTKYGTRHQVVSEPRGPRCATCNRTERQHNLAESKVAAQHRHDWASSPPHRQTVDIAALINNTYPTKEN